MRPKIVPIRIIFDYLDCSIHVRTVNKSVLCLHVRLEIFHFLIYWGDWCGEIISTQSSFHPKLSWVCTGDLQYLFKNVQRRKFFVWNRDGKSLSLLIMTIAYTREHWLIYRGPGFLAVAWFGSTSTPPPSPPPQQLVSPFQSSQSPVELTDGRGGGGGRGAKSNDIEKAWPSINHSILSVLHSI